jgi:hypothetical protein
MWAPGPPAGVACEQWREPKSKVRFVSREADLNAVSVEGPPYVAVATSIRAEIERQQKLDSRWRSYQATLDARMRAVVGAQRPFAQRELGAGWALRQSLVDLASVCELLADELPRPRA